MSMSGLISAALFLQLATAALHKALDPERARTATARLLGPAAPMAKVAAPAAALIEAACAIAFLLPGWADFGAAGAATLWLVYAGAASAAWLAGERRFDCGCTFAGKARPGDVRIVAARAGAMAGVAALLLVESAEPVWRDPLALGAALGFAALAIAASQLLLNRHYQGNLAT